MSRRSAALASGPYAPPVPVRELTVVSADGSRLHAELHGPEDAPAVVLAHGWTCSTAFWAPVLRHLATDHRVVVYDQRGHGRSPAPGPGGYSTHALADDLAAVLDQTLPPGRRAVVVGHSLGGMTLLAAAGCPQLRERAAAVVLCSTGAGRLVERARVVPLRAGRLRTRVQRAVLGTRAPLGPVTPLGKRVLRYVTMGRGARPAAVEACARIVHACPRTVRAEWAHVLAELDLDAGIAELTMPAAVIVGTADRLTPPEHAHALVAGLPHCVGLTELPGLGHMTPVEDPAAVSGVIRGLAVAYGQPAEPVAEAAPDAEEQTT
ncbi:alpha/beta fold hydrolase [Streptomyces sp. NA02950]|uniref:alpha/beta fold hydrolase n=1 Tax=Streptomyces sp. NA02950 TaxID=2742137 RepID=UPI001590A756|nr:alpha/beta fold hydrolase [Streptomyces sp. NA02950]QKV92935.1 alpha/beta fold hydrolase [Streptomyces sp. NA02950]